MAAVTCRCGAKLIDVDSTAPHIHRLIDAWSLDAVTDYAAGTIDDEAFDERSVEALICYACKRLLVEDKATGVYRSYFPETDSSS